MQGKVVESCFASTDAAALNLKCRKTKHEREPKLLSWHDQKTTTLATTTTTAKKLATAKNPAILFQQSRFSSST